MKKIIFILLFILPFISFGQLYYTNPSTGNVTIHDTVNKEQIIKEYISSDVWYKPIGVKYIMVVCVGAGGGGGSGRVGAASSVRAGGDGGGGATVVTRFISASELTDSVTITIGVGGNGGDTVKTNNTNGNAGTVGTATTFGSLVSARFGLAGGGGASTNGSGQGAANLNVSIPPQSRYCIKTTTTSPASTGSNVSLTPLVNSQTGSLTSGGGAGGSISAANVRFLGGSVSGALDSANQTVYNSSAVTGIGESGVNGVNNVVKCLLFKYNSNTLLTKGIGTMGGGGNCGDEEGTIAGGKGGDSGYGCGGAGGGASTNGANSGAGGKGGGGLCIVLELY